MSLCSYSVIDRMGSGSVIMLPGLSKIYRLLLQGVLLDVCVQHIIFARCFVFQHNQVDSLRTGLLPEAGSCARGFTAPERAAVQRASR